MKKKKKVEKIIRIRKRKIEKRFNGIHSTLGREEGKERESLGELEIGLEMREREGRSGVAKACAIASGKLRKKGILYCVSFLSVTRGCFGFRFGPYPNLLLGLGLGFEFS